MRYRWRGALGVTLLASSVACIEGLEQIHDVRDMRVLAIVAEPPEVMYSLGRDPTAPFPFVPSTPQVTFDALVVNPLGDELRYEWSFCPIESSTMCLDYLERLDAIADSDSLQPCIEAFGFDRDLVADLNQLRHEFRAPAGPGIVTPVSGTDDPVPPYGIASFTLDFTDPIFDMLFAYHLCNSGAGAGFGSFPSVILRVENESGTLEVEKRIVLSISPDSMRAIAAMADSFGLAPGSSGGSSGNTFGVSFCPLGKTSKDVPGCLMLESRGPNTNPVFEKVQIFNGADASGEFLDASARPYIYPYGPMRILPLFTAASSETYQFLKADLDTRRIFVQNATEQMAVSWFTNSGDLADNLTFRLFTKSLDTIYTAPSEPPAETDGLVNVWMVVRDQRGGNAWTRLEIEVVPLTIYLEKLQQKTPPWK